MLTDVRQKVAENPEDWDLRGRLVELLLEATEFDEAVKHLDVLTTELPDESWPLFLGVRLSVAKGDSLRAAHFKRRLRSLSNEADDEGDWMVQPHPSSLRDETGNGPYLRLLTGGAESGSLQQGEAVERRLDDIVGLSTVQRNLVDILESVRSAEAAADGAPGWLGGVLLYGPPGCGKHFCGEVVAGELGAPLWTFDLNHQWNEGSLVKAVRTALRQSPESVVLYFEALDVAGTRKNTTLLEQLMALLDEASQAQRIVVLGAAIYPWQVNPSIVGSEHLKRVLLILPPDGPSRRVFLTKKLAQVDVADDDIEWLVQHTEGHSFADLVDVIDRAQALAAESNTDNALSHQHLRHARQQIPSSSSDWLTTAGHHALINQESGLYDDLLAYFRHRERQ